MLRLIGTSRSSIASSCPPFLRGRGCLQVTSSASFTSRLVGLACVSRTSQGDGSAVVWPNKTSSSPGCCLSACMMAHHVSSNWWLCLLLPLPLPIQSIPYRIPPPPPPRCPVTAVPWIPAGTPILVPPQNHPLPRFPHPTPPSFTHPTFWLRRRPGRDHGPGVCALWHWDSHPLNLHHRLR